MSSLHFMQCSATCELAAQPGRWWSTLFPLLRCLWHFFNCGNFTRFCLVVLLNAPVLGCFQVVYVMPSSSARCAHLPRASDKVPFYIGLKKLRDHICGSLPNLQESEVCFPDLELKVTPKVKVEPQVKMEEGTKHVSNGQFQPIVANGLVNGNGLLNGLSHPHIKQEPGVTSNGVDFLPKGTVHHTPALNVIQEDASKLSSSAGISVVPKTGTPSSANAHVTSRQGTPVSNQHSHRQSTATTAATTALYKNQEHTWTRPSVPAASSASLYTQPESTAHLPCTSSTLLTSEWINKHFNSVPPAQPVVIHHPWNVRNEQPSPHSPWHLGLNTAGYVKPELPSDGYGSVPPSR